MTDIAIPDRQHSPAVPTAASLPAQSPFAIESSPIALWAHEADLAYQLAEKLSTTSFVPASMRGRVGDIAGCIIAGKELGLSPMVALKSMDVIQGTPALRVHAMRALLQSNGHEIELVESTPTLCRMRGRRQGVEKWQEVVWPIARAQQLGLLGKDQWKKQPQTMLTARATGEICRLVASDALHGMGYNTAELSDTEIVVSAARLGAPVTAAEILGNSPAPVPELAAPVEEDEPAEGEFVDTPAEQAPAPSRWQIAWSEVATLAQGLGWSKEQTEAEFTKENPGLTIENSSVDDLAAFANYLMNLAGGAA